jgi:hypothetical protein
MSGLTNRAQKFSEFFWNRVFCAAAVVFICSARSTAASAAAAQAVFSYTPKEVGSCCDHNENNDYSLHDFISALYLGLAFIKDYTNSPPIW